MHLKSMVEQDTPISVRHEKSNEISARANLRMVSVLLIPANFSGGGTEPIRVDLHYGMELVR